VGGFQGNHRQVSGKGVLPVISGCTSGFSAWRIKGRSGEAAFTHQLPGLRCAEAQEVDIDFVQRFADLLQCGAPGAAEGSTSTHELQAVRITIFPKCVCACSEAEEISTSERGQTAWRFLRTRLYGHGAPELAH